jgi:hypothetical protein
MYLFLKLKKVSEILTDNEVKEVEIIAELWQFFSSYMGPPYLSSSPLTSFTRFGLLQQP